MNEPSASTSSSALPREPEPRAGLGARLLSRVFFRAAEVAENRAMGGGMHLITLQGPALRDVRWNAGDKLQLRIGPGLLTRTYTPIDWDAARGHTRILAHALAIGPGSEWVRRASPGQAVGLLGPRRSLALADRDPRYGLLLGDETAIGLAAAWRPARAIFETCNPAAIQPLLDTLDLPATALAAHIDGLHRDAMVQAATARLGPRSQLVLAGRAHTVQHLLRALRHEGVPASQILTKAYWSDGKTGLD
ncbi:siderophore-interacting protein [Kinneretia asaccharophila]|uniref:Siderophore-interacting protein n=1 Tax=Roseateles asaccharophilus TaxID=582607 RepID=A0A4R6N2D2_9BURK|nr:siderophore-interacting protein [Roseateles asaccharophilus]MDN3544188.1 siderophore-interacting protein [Roseateles asaccharophilus]TDP09218.1 siderophore-interacting protein [Roseateles asaccharophilus]